MRDCNIIIFLKTYFAKVNIAERHQKDAHNYSQTTQLHLRSKSITILQNFQSRSYHTPHCELRDLNYYSYYVIATTISKRLLFPRTSPVCDESLLVVRGTENLKRHAFCKTNVEPMIEGVAHRVYKRSNHASNGH